MQTRVRFVRLLTVMLLGICAAFAGAQTITGGINGIVTDASGAVVPNAKIVATNVDTGVATPTTSNNDGVYALRFLQIGTYKVSIEAPGFSTSNFGPFKLETGQNAKIDAKLSVAGANQNVSVDSSVVPLLNTESAVLGTTLDTRAIENMPLVSRNIVAVTMFLPGAIATQPNNFVGQQAISGPLSSSTSVSVNANRQQTNQYLLDGMNINQTLDDTPGYNPSVDAIGEVKVISANAPAEYGNVLGGDILFQTKTGTNQFHGSAFYFLTDDALNANTWANKRNPAAIIPKTSFTRNIFGATLGGPIWKDKLFFFGDYQGGRYHSGGISTATVLTEKMRTGDFSELLNPALMCSASAGVCDRQNRLIQLYDATAAGFPAYANNKITIANPAAQYLINHPEYYPLPNRAPNATNTPASSNYQAPSKNRNYGNQFDVKIDYKFSQKDSLNGRFSYADQGSTTTTVLPTSFSSAPKYPVRGVAFNEVHTFNSSVVNEFRAGYTRIVSIAATLIDPTGAFGTSGNSILGIPGGQPYQGFSALSMNNSSSPQTTSATNGTEFSTLGTANTNTNFNLNTFLFGDNLTMLKSRHTFKMGVQFQRQQQNNFYPGNDGSMGGFYYLGAGTTSPTVAAVASTAAPSATGYTAADFLLNRATFVSKGGVAGPVGMRSWRSAYFFQDDWKVTPNLTLNLGVRYEYVQPFYEVNNKMSTLSLENPSVGIITAGSALAKSLGYNRSLVDPYYGSVMPRIGFAWSTTPRFVVRGGYGLQNFMEGTGANLRMTTNLPFQSATQMNATPATTTSVGSFFTTQNGFTGSGVTSTNVFNVWNKKIKPAFIGIYNLTLEYQLNNTASVQVGYVGESGQHLVTANQRNQLTSPCIINGAPVAPTLTGANAATCAAQKPAPFANIVGYTGTVRYTDSNAMMNYNGLQATFRQRQWHGLQYTANYTWAHSFTNSVGFYGVPGVSVQSAYANNTYNMHNEYGPSGYDVRHSVNWNMVYDLPFGRNRMFGGHMPFILDEAIGGWKVGMTGIAYTGFPVTLVATNNSYVNGNSQRANHYRALKVVNRSSTNWFGTDPSAVPCSGAGVDNGVCAYGQPAAGTFGTARPNSERAPSYQTYGASVTKDFTIWHEHQINFRADADNLFNSAYLSNPGNNVTSATFGQITAVRSGPRNLQLSVKYHF